MVPNLDLRRHKRVRLTRVLFTFLCAAALHAQITPGPQVVTFLSDVDNTDQPYGLYIPRKFDPAKRYPLVISLHGADSNHRLNLRRVFGQGNRPAESDVEATRHFPRFHDVEYIVASPLARGTMGYQGIAEKDVYDVLADVKRRFRIDEDRIYLTGLSMGGGGTLWLGLTRPDLWAAIAPVCPAPPNGIEPLAGNALNIPVKLFQGALDPVVKVEDTRRWREDLSAAGVNVDYVEYATVRHNAWDFAYKEASIFDWFSTLKRNVHPARVNFTTREYRYRQAYWVQLDKLTPGSFNSIDARFTAKNKLTIVTKNLDGFTITLKSHPMFAPSLPVTVIVDGATISVKPAATISLSKAANRWTTKRSVFAPGEKQPGAEGPISAVTAARHIYVYGTADSPSNEELLRRQHEATVAATWSTTKRPLMATFPVLSDAEVKQSDLTTANLVLFGSRDTNAVIAKLAPKLPLRLNAGAADYGMVYVWPTTAGHYALINSGLPWWTRADQARRAGLPLIPDAYLILNTFPDFVIFKGGLDDVVAEGYFDSHWHLPAAARSKIEATGAIELR